MGSIGSALLRRRSASFRCGLIRIVGLVNAIAFSSSTSSSSVVDGVTAIEGIFVGMECLRNVSDDDLRGLWEAGIADGRNCRDYFEKKNHF